MIQRWPPTHIPTIERVQRRVCGQQKGVALNESVTPVGVLVIWLAWVLGQTAFLVQEGL